MSLFSPRWLYLFPLIIALLFSIYRRHRKTETHHRSALGRDHRSRESRAAHLASRHRYQ